MTVPALCYWRGTTSRRRSKGCETCPSPAGCRPAAARRRDRACGRDSASEPRRPCGGRPGGGTFGIGPAGRVDRPARASRGCRGATSLADRRVPEDRRARPHAPDQGPRGGRRDPSRRRSDRRSSVPDLVDRFGAGDHGSYSGRALWDPGRGARGDGFRSHGNGGRCAHADRDGRGAEPSGTPAPHRRNVESCNPTGPLGGYVSTTPIGRGRCPS
jgi:hypothetical protein